MDATRPSNAVRLALTAAALALACGAALGCNLVVGDYSVEGTHWGCVGSVAQPAAVDGGQVAITFVPTPFTAGDTLPEMTVRACAKDSMSCEPIASATSGASGGATVTVPSGFAGYFDATGGDEMESLVYLGLHPASDATYPLLVGTFDEYKRSVMAVEGTVAPMTGALWVNTEDCLGQPAAGVRLSLDPTFSAGTDPFYFLDGVPVSAQSQPATSSDAVGGFADVMPGLPTLTAALASNGETLATLPAYVRVKTLTVAWLPPTPPDE